ncbi:MULTISPECIES: DUF6146 family protein [Galbibacter]|uniref:DUF6146 family protein n=1 Tax=Galbibacter pacificus TaxID=2996052 RepID=A0ABT6FQ65_9FLAO|nr:DUF6146 family protein [Galbibacter pacificus]MDG3582115.1 DUF6146 family protein [Galbibacter pacificus]MDG3585409.1 DUF6146 family protein [Galbibacter pacificus]
MKYVFAIVVLSFLAGSCSGTKSASTSTNTEDEMELDISEAEKEAFNATNAEQDTVRIANDSTEYEIIVIDPGYYTWLNSIAMPEGYYSQEYMETRNNIYVINWNQRVLNPQRYNPNLYEMQINYSPNIDYGYEVNYKLYNYFLYFQRKYNQRLGPFFPRIR